MYLHGFVLLEVVLQVGKGPVVIPSYQTSGDEMRQDLSLPILILDGMKYEQSWNMGKMLLELSLFRLQN